MTSEELSVPQRETEHWYHEYSCLLSVSSLTNSETKLNFSDKQQNLSPVAHTISRHENVYKYFIFIDFLKIALTPDVILHKFLQVLS